MTRSKRASSLESGVPRAVVLCALALSVGSHSSVARAEGDTPSEHAKALFKEARALASAGKYDAACPKFEESLALDVGIGTQFNLADCREHVGRPLAARSLFLEVATLAHASGQTEREQAAKERADALGAKIPKLVIDVKVAAPKLEVRADRTEVRPETWGAPFEVEPGPHDIEATAPGRKPFKVHVEASLEHSPLTVALPELESEEKANPVVAAVPEPKQSDGKTGKDEPEKADASPEPPPPAGPDNTVPILIYAGVGAGALLAGTSFVLYKITNDKAKDVCPTSTGCTLADVRDHTDLVRNAQTMRTLGYVGVGVLGASLVTAGILTLSHPGSREKSHPARLTAAPVVARDQLGASVAGSF